MNKSIENPASKVMSDEKNEQKNYCFIHITCTHFRYSTESGLFSIQQQQQQHSLFVL